MMLALWYHPLLAVLFAFTAIVLMGVILLQRGKGVGLSGAFGGAGGHTAFGAKTGDFLTWATIVVAVGLLIFAILLNFVFRPLSAPGTASIGPAPVSTPAMPVESESAPVSEPIGETVPDAGGGDAPLPDIFGIEHD